MSPISDSNSTCSFRSTAVSYFFASQLNHPSFTDSSAPIALKLDPASSPLEFYIAGGAQIYEQALPFCSDLYLTLVKREVEGDAFFPPFEDKFDLVETLRDEPEFKILHYRHKSLAD